MRLWLFRLSLYFSLFFQQYTLFPAEFSSPQTELFFLFYRPFYAVMSDGKACWWYCDGCSDIKQQHLLVLVEANVSSDHHIPDSGLSLFKLGLFRSTHLCCAVKSAILLMGSSLPYLPCSSLEVYSLFFTVVNKNNAVVYPYLSSINYHLDRNTVDSFRQILAL